MATFSVETRSQTPAPRARLAPPLPARPAPLGAAPLASRGKTPPPSAPAAPPCPAMVRSACLPVPTGRGRTTPQARGGRGRRAVRGARGDSSRLAPPRGCRCGRAGGQRDGVNSPETGKRRLNYFLPEPRVSITERRSKKQTKQNKHSGGVIGKILSRTEQTSMAEHNMFVKVSSTET